MRLPLALTTLLIFTLPQTAAATAAATAATTNTPPRLDYHALAMRITPIVTNLRQPWALAFLPNRNLLITERDGRLLHATRDGNTHPISGVPPVVARGQGGLLDVAIARDFPQTREIFLSYSKHLPNGRGIGTALATARLSEDTRRLTNLRVLFEMKHGGRGGRHFGSRIVEATDGNLFLTIGERGDREKAQSLTHHHGKVIRIRRDGSIPPDNPKLPNALPEIWSYGHRNAQGAALNLDGTLLLNEHGARGGDEVNHARPGANYGWPRISYGRHYSGAKIGEGTAAPGLQQPLFYWDPSIAPSGMAVYSGKQNPNWRGDVFVGSLKFDHISHLRPGKTGTAWREIGQIQTPETERVRDVREGPDGALWFLSVGNRALYRITFGEN